MQLSRRELLGFTPAALIGVGASLIPVYYGFIKHKLYSHPWIPDKVDVFLNGEEVTHLCFGALSIDGFGYIQLYKKDRDGHLYMECRRCKAAIFREMDNDNDGSCRHHGEVATELKFGRIDMIEKSNRRS